jgi:riboflavin biosynthesis pyrimidine reductase
MTTRIPRSRPVVTAAFTASWDGRLLEIIAPHGRADAQLSDTRTPYPVLKRLHSQGARRIAFAGSPALFRRLCAEGLLDEISVTWCPSIGGGPPITGLPGRYLPHGIALDLVRLERRGAECVARYRVQATPH